MSANTRIRYKDGGGVLTSRRHFTTGTGREVMVELDTVGKVYRVLDSVSREIVASGGDTINVAVLKIQAKAGLAALGVNFAPEARHRADIDPNEDAKRDYDNQVARDLNSTRGE